GTCIAGGTARSARVAVCVSFRLHEANVKKGGRGEENKTCKGFIKARRTCGYPPFAPCARFAFSFFFPWAVTFGRRRSGGGGRGTGTKDAPVGSCNQLPSRAIGALGRSYPHRVRLEARRYLGLSGDHEICRDARRKNVGQGYRDITGEGCGGVGPRTPCACA